MVGTRSPLGAFEPQCFQDLSLLSAIPTATKSANLFCINPTKQSVEHFTPSRVVSPILAIKHLMFVLCSLPTLFLEESGTRTQLKMEDSLHQPCHCDGKYLVFSVNGLYMKILKIKKKNPVAMNRG